MELLLGSAQVGEISEGFGVLKATSFSRYVAERAWERGRIPEPDAKVGGRFFGWREETVAGWLVEKGVDAKAAHAIVTGPTGAPKGSVSWPGPGFWKVGGGRAALGAWFETGNEDPPRQVFRAALENLIYCRAREVGVEVATSGVAGAPGGLPAGGRSRGPMRRVEAFGGTARVLRLAEELAANGAGGFLVEVGTEEEAKRFAHVPAEVLVLGAAPGSGKEDGPDA